MTRHLSEGRRDVLAAILMTALSVAASTAQRTPPHDLVAEASVLGAILIDNSVFSRAAAVVVPNDFYRVPHRTILECIAGLLERESVADLVTVVESLGRNGRLDDVGGPAYVASLVDGVPHSANVEHYARIVKEKARLRTLIADISRALDSAYLAESAAPVVADIDAIVRTSTKADASAALTVIGELDLGRISQAPALIPGFVANGVNLLVAGPGVGKTTLAFALSVRVAANLPFLGIDVVDPGPVVIIAAEGAGASLARLRAAKRGAGLNPDAPIGVSVIPHSVDLFRLGPTYTAFRRHLADAGIRFIVVDTLGLNIAGADENNAVEMTMALGALRELGVASLALHHLDKANRAERGSSAIRANADALLTLIEADDVLTLSVDKLRDGVPAAPARLKLVTLPEMGACTVLPERDVYPSDNLSTAQRAALLALWAGFGTSSASRSEWLALLPTVKERTAYHAIQRLQALGFVAESKGRFTALRRAPGTDLETPSQSPAMPLQGSLQTAAQPDCKPKQVQFSALQGPAMPLQTRLQCSAGGSLDPHGTLQTAGGRNDVRV